MIKDHTYLPSPPLDALKHELPRAQIAFDPGTDPAAAAALAANRMSPSSSSRSTTAKAMTAASARRQSGRAGRGGRESQSQERSSSSRAAAPFSCLGSIRSRQSSKPSPRHPRRPGDRPDPDRQGRPVGPPADHFPGLRRPTRASGLPGLGLPDGTPAHITYDEGAAIGYKWYDVKGYQPLFAFGHGLSYTRFALSGLTAQPEARRSRSVSRCAMSASARARVSLRSMLRPPTGRRPVGSPQAPRRIHENRSQAGAEQDSTLTVDPRLLATYEAAGNNWHIAPANID